MDGRIKLCNFHHKGKQDSCFTLFRPCDILYKIRQLSRISDDRRLSGVLYTENTDCALAGYCRCAVFFSDAVEERNRYMGIARKKKKKTLKAKMLGILTMCAMTSLLAAVIVSYKMFIAIGTGYLFNVIPLPVVYMVILIAIFSFLLSKTKFGTYVYAIGGNREAARLSGVPIKKIEIIVFTLSGALAAFAGLVLCSRMYSGQPSVGSGYELDAIAACVLGGTSMTGGKGRISGTVFGAMVIGIISNGLNLIGVSSYWQLIIKGLIIACAVLLDCQKDKIALLKNKVRAAK